VFGVVMLLTGLDILLPRHRADEPPAHHNFRPTL
jgi:hypothetical protein